MAKDYLIIDRSKWRTGRFSTYSDNRSGKGYTALLNPEGYMCCLGFRCHQMGIPKKELLNNYYPSSLTQWDIPDLVKKDGNHTQFCRTAININDDVNISRTEREKKIKEHFATIGVTVEFTGKYKKA